MNENRVGNQRKNIYLFCNKRLSQPKQQAQPNYAFMTTHSPRTVALADDNFVFREGLSRTIERFGDFSIVINEDDAEQMFRKMGTLPVPPSVCIMDMAIPEGYQVLKKMKDAYPTVRVLILSMLDNEMSIIRTVKIGANGFLLKGCSPADLHQALLSVTNEGSYFRQSAHLPQASVRESLLVQLSYTELELLSLVCTEMNMRQIAERMNTNLKTIEKHRDTLQQKLGVHSRIGLVLFAMNIGVQPANL